MKTKIKRHSRSVLAVVLTLCMLVSCMTVGMIATDAAKTADERVGAADDGKRVGAVDDSESVGANVEFYYDFTRLTSGDYNYINASGAWSYGTDRTQIIKGSYPDNNTDKVIAKWQQGGWDTVEVKVSDIPTGKNMLIATGDSSYEWGVYGESGGGGGGGSNTDAKWDEIFVERNKTTNTNEHLYSAKDDTLTSFADTGLDAYDVDGKIYFKIPVDKLNGTGAAYFMLVGETNGSHTYKDDWYQITNNNGNSILKAEAGTDSTDYLNVNVKERYGQETNVNTNTRYYYSQVNMTEDGEGNFSYVVLEINPAQNTRSFTFYAYGATSIAKKAKVVVENGSYGYQSRFGTASITEPAGLTYSTGAWYKTYRVDEGTQLYITTTNAGSQNSSMYVYAYSVNGVKYEVKDNGDGTYVNVKPITVGTENIEVTPVYYSKTIEANNDYISIYVDATDELIEHWGNQIYVYSYYYDAEGNGSEGRMDGNYPGQTLVLDASGYYYGKVAKYYYSNNYTTKDATHHVSGVTFSGGYENNAPHHAFIDYAQNRQTYDYDDFYYIANLGYDTVRLDLKYTAQTSSSNQYQLINNATNQPGTDKTPATIDVSKVQGWQYLYDFDYKPCSVLGISERLYGELTEAGYTYSDSWNDANPYGTDHNVKIVSVGNQNVSGTGEWSTYWYVYKKNGSGWDFVTKGLPSDFITRTRENNIITASEQTDQWKAVVAAGIAFEAADIAYEAEMKASTSTTPSNTGHRIDGRWIYTLSNEANYQVHAGVALLNNDGTYTFKENFNNGTLKAAAYIDGKTNHTKNDNISTKTFKERNVEATLSTDIQSGDYYFEYWALVKDTLPDSNLSVGDTLSGVNKLAAGEDPTTKITASTDQFFVAVYKQITGGKLVVQHNAYTDGGKTGLGDRYITADIVQSNGTTVVKSFNKAKGSLTLSGITNQMSDRDYQIRIKLDAVSLRDSKFNSYWLPANNAVASSSPTYEAEDPANAKKGAVTTENDSATYTTWIPISSVWNIINASESASSADAYTIVYKSDFDREVVEYNLKYNYESYIGSHVNYGSQYYVQKGQFTDSEIDEYLIWDDEMTTNDGQTGYYKFNPETEGKFLALKSPYEKNIRRDLKWDFSDLSKIKPRYNKQNNEIAVDVSASDPLVPNVRLQFIMPYRIQTDETNGVVAQKTNGQVVELKDTDPSKSGSGSDQYSKYLTVAIPQARVYELNWQKRDVNPNLDPMYVTAVESIVDKDDATKIKHFQYWSIQTVPADVTSDDYKEYEETKRRYEVARCYNLEFNFTAYQDYIIEPVYGDAVSTHEHENSATITFTENGRNQWNAAGGKGDANWNYGDRIFSDFMISFDRADKLMLNTVTDNSVTTGLVVETVGKIEKVNGVYTPKSEKEYANLYGENPSTEDVLAFINGGSYNGTYEKSTIKLSSLDNKNRIEFYRGVPNITQKADSFAEASETDRKYNVYRAYAYMKDANGVVISKPVYYTIYDIATIANGDSEASYQGKAA